MPRSVKKTIIVLAVLLMLLVPISKASADMGPKPNAEFFFEYETADTLTIVEAHFFSCESKECNEPQEWEGVPQYFSCTLEDCYSWSYGYSEYSKLVISFSDGVTRQSNIFEKKYYNAEYIVTVYPDSLYVEEPPLNFGSLETQLVACCFGMLLLIGLLVSIGVLVKRGEREKSLEDTSNRWIIAIWVIGGLILLGSLFLWFSAELNVLSLPLTVLIEGGLIIAYCFYRDQPWKIPAALNLSGNLLTQLVLVGIIGQLSTNPKWGAIILAEGLIVITEALILYWPQRHQVAFKQALSLSLFLNIASFTVGLFLPI